MSLDVSNRCSFLLDLPSVSILGLFLLAVVPKANTPIKLTAGYGPHPGTASNARGQPLYYCYKSEMYYHAQKINVSVIAGVEFIRECIC